MSSSTMPHLKRPQPILTLSSAPSTQGNMKSSKRTSQTHPAYLHLPDEILKNHLSIDCLILNNGTTSRKNLDEITPDGWNAVISTNFTAPLFLILNLNSYLQQNGCIIFIGSLMVNGKISAFSLHLIWHLKSRGTHDGKISGERVCIKKYYSECYCSWFCWCPMTDKQTFRDSEVDWKQSGTRKICPAGRNCRFVSLYHQQRLHKWCGTCYWWRILL